MLRKALGSDELYATAVTEFGHMLAGTLSMSTAHKFLRSKDILDLNTYHKVRAAVGATGFLPVEVVLTALPMHSGSVSTAHEGADSPTDDK